MGEHCRKVMLFLSLAICLVTDLFAQGIDENPDLHEVYEDLGNGVMRELPLNSPYEKWFQKARADMPSFEGLIVQDARTVPLTLWPRMGVNGLYVKMANYQITDAWVLELPPGGRTLPQRHLFEAGMYFFSGPGHILLQQEGRPEEKVPFQPHTVFSVPLNVRYQVVNESEQPVRLVVVTSFPFMINSTANASFVLDNPFAFHDRYDAEEDFSTLSEHMANNYTATNRVPDALAAELDDYAHRGKDATAMHWGMSGNTMLELHVSAIPPSRYKKAHRHSSDAFILVLSGRGYSLTWPDDRFEEHVRVEWQAGTIFVPPTYWYHQHLNPNGEPARYLAINAPNLVRNIGLRFKNQIENDRPEIRAEFEARVVEQESAEQP